MTVKASRTEIEVSGGGLSEKQTIEIDDPMGTGFGFFSDHYSHNCSRIGNFTLENINLKTELSKRLEEVLREPDWRENSIKVLVNVGDYENKQLSKPETLGELLTRMLNDEIYYVGWGNDTNKTEMNNLILANNNNGKFINNTSYETSVDETAEYIKTLLPTTNGTNYIILGDNTFLSSPNSSIMNNTAGGSYPNGRWKVIHDCEYFENNLGQFQKSGRYLSNMITTFDKTGKYEITYEDNPTNPNIIYVHRRPVAEIEVQRSGTNITLVGKGFDWDHRSEVNKGVVEEEWKWRKVGDTTWNSGKLTNISSYDNYLVQLRVRDKEGIWSMPVSKYITKVTDIPPIASFKIENSVLSVYEDLVIQDGSYDPYGRELTSKEWTIIRNGIEVFKGPAPKRNFLDQGIGKYTMSLKVTNSDGQVSEPYTRNFEVRQDNEAPEVTINPTQCNWTDSVDVTYSFKDRLGSGYKEHKYALTNSTTEPASSKWVNGPSNNKITVDSPGEWYLHIKATDNAGNTSEDRVVGPYKIDGVDPEGTTSHTPTQWTNQKVTISYSFTDNESGMKNVKLPSGGVTTNKSGNYDVTQNGKYKFIGTDKAGNSCEVTETIENIDRLKPTVTFSPNGGNKYMMPTTGNAKITTTLVASDAEKTTTDGKSDIQIAKYAWSQSNTAEPTEGWINFTASGETVTKSDITAPGTWYLWTKVIDNAGNRASDSSGKAILTNGFTVNSNTGDSCKITLTPDKTTWTNTNVTVSATYGEFLTENKTLTCDGTINTNYTVNGTTNVVVKTNERTVTARAEDIAGNAITKTYKVTIIDKLKPTVTFSQNGGDKYVMPTTGNAKITTRLTAWDQAKTANDGQSNLQIAQYAWSQSNTVEPTTGWTNFTASGETITKADITGAGTWYLWTKVIDNAGNRASADNGSIIVANGFTIHPNTDDRAKITLTPDKTAWTNTNVTVSATYGTFLTQNKTLTCDGTMNTNYTVNGTTNVVVKTNERTVTARAEDIAGNIITKTYKVTNIDRLKPIITFSQNGGDKYVMPTTGNAKITTRLTAWDQAKTANDGQSNLQIAQYAWSQSNTVEPTTGWTNFTASGETITKADITGAGTWYLWTKVIDNAGNRASDDSGKTIVANGFTVYSNTDERAKITLTPNITRWTNTDVTVSATYGEFLTQNKVLTCEGTASVDYTINGFVSVIVISNEKTVTATAEDIAGNKIVKTYRVTNIDKILPVENITHMPTDWVIDYLTINWEFTDDQSGIDHIKLPNGETTTQTRGQYLVLDNGDYNFTAYDVAGNVKNVTKTINNIDKIKPEGALSLSTNDLTDTQLQINWEAIDNESGFSKIVLPDTTISNDEEGSFVVSKIGTYTFIIYDKVGNERELSIEVNNVDLEKPNLKITQKVVKWTNEDVDLYWTASDNQSGLREVILPNSESSKQKEGKHTVTQNGIYTFLAYDNVGNGIIVKHEVNNIDKTAPILILKTQTNEKGNIEIIWEAKDTGSGFKNIVLPNGDVVKQSKGIYETTRNGIYTFIAYDRVGNEILVKQQVNDIDKTAPTLTLKTQANEKGSIDIIWEATDDQSGYRDIVLPNGQVSEQNSGIYEATQNGTYTFTAYDNAGNGISMEIDIDDLDTKGIEFEIWQEQLDDNNYKIYWKILYNQKDYKHILLPDNTYSEEKEGYFVTKEEGEYIFQCYDNVGNETVKKIEIKGKE